jgi:hypothetical protein
MTHKKLKTYKVLLSYVDEYTNQMGVRLVKLKAHTKSAARKLALDLIWSCDPWIIEAMGIDGQDHVDPIELLGVFPTSKNDIPSRVWTPEELEDGDLEELVREPEPFSIETSAYHEAGHAWVVYALGWELTGLEVYEERRINNADSSEGGICDYMLPFNSDDEDEILVSLAGPVAESMFKDTAFSIASMIGMSTGRSALGGSGDFESANAAAKEIHFDAGGTITHRHLQMIETYLTYMAQRVRVQYLDPQWNTIDCIAKALIEKKKMSGIEVVALIESLEAKPAA